MLRRKLQVFVSSTYKDLVDARLATMEAILAAGHIPAAMEQFPPGDHTALEKIGAWIRSSDAYILILGGRYGSRAPMSSTSYVELEYDLALKLGKPFFALVASDLALQRRTTDPLSLETSAPEYRAFKATVLRHHCAFWDNLDQVRSVVHQTLPHWAVRDDLVGWIRRDQQRESAPISVHPFRAIVEVDSQDQNARPVAFDVAHREGRTHRVVHVEIHSGERARHLVLRRNELQRRLELLGGHVDWIDEADRPETYLECCKRELKEELSLVENLPISETEVNAGLDACVSEVGACFNSGVSTHQENREHVRICRMSWPESWPDPTQPWWKWNDEVICAYWISDRELLSRDLRNDMMNTSLRMFRERIVAQQQAIASTTRTT